MVLHLPASGQPLGRVLRDVQHSLETAHLDEPSVTRRALLKRVIGGLLILQADVEQLENYGALTLVARDGERVG